MKKNVKNWFKICENAYISACKEMKRAYPVLYMIKDGKDMALPIPKETFRGSPMSALKPLIYDYMPDAYLFCGQVEIRTYKFKEGEIPTRLSKDDPKLSKSDAIMMFGRTMKGEKFRELYRMHDRGNEIILKKDKHKKELNKAKAEREP